MRKPFELDDALVVRIKQGGFVTYADRCAIYEIFKSVGDNLAETGRVTGLAPITVKRYIDQVQRQAQKEVDAERTDYSLAVREEVKLQMSEREIKFIAMAAELKQKGLERMKAILEDTELISSVPLRDLTSTVKTLHEITTGNTLSQKEAMELENKGKGLAIEQAMRELTLVQQNITINKVENNKANKKQNGKTAKKHTAKRNKQTITVAAK